MTPDGRIIWFAVDARSGQILGGAPYSTARAPYRREEEAPRFRSEDSRRAIMIATMAGAAVLTTVMIAAIAASVTRTTVVSGITTRAAGVAKTATVADRTGERCGFWWWKTMWICSAT